MQRTLRVILLTVLILLLGGLLVTVSRGTMLGVAIDDLLLSRSYSLVPAPWQMPKKEGEAVLRLAMVHDVLHERYVRHGPAWHQARLTRAERELGTLPDDPAAVSERQFAALDDIAVAHERLGHPELGIPLLRRKLALQRARLPAGTPQPAPALYTTYANLGTLLIHASIAGAMRGDEPSREALREGLQLIRDAMTANQDAHFGRETWQAVAVESLLAAMAAPARMQTLDLIGLPLEDGGLPRPRPHLQRSYLAMLQAGGGWDTIRAACIAGDEERRAAVRARIPSVVRIEAQGSQREEVPCDEPALGLIGMWTLGGGANPHSALALAHLMEAMHQRRLAWDAYERAVELGDAFWPEPAIRQRIIEHCRTRQHALASSLGEQPEDLRARHQAELAAGLAYRAAYQQEEAALIAAGRDPDDPALMRDFAAGRQPIATPAGDADSYLVAEPARLIDRIPLWIGALSLAIAAALVVEWLDRRRSAHRPGDDAAGGEAPG